MRYISFFFLGLTLFLATPVLAGEKLNGEQIKALLTGKTVEGNAGADIHFIKTYNTDGTFVITFKGERKEMTGTWTVKADEYCQTRRERQNCFTVEKGEDGYRMFEKEKLHTFFQVK